MAEISRRATLSLGLSAGIGASLAAIPGRVEAAPTQPSFTLLLVNDIYRMSEKDGRGGFARLAAIVRAERARGVPVLFCHAGDSFSPSLMSGFDQGAHIVELLNLIGPDAFVPGNHEFDFGRDVFLKRIGEARFPVYAANLRGVSGAPLPGVRDTDIVTLGAVKVGLVGIALASTPKKAQTGDLVFGPELETLRARARDLRAAGAEFIVALAHTERETDNAIVASRTVDVLLSGHDHDLAINYDGHTVMVESSEEGYFVTAIDITVTRGGEDRKLAWTPSFRVHDSSAVEPDPEVLAVVRRLEGELSKELDVEIGTTAVDLDSATEIVRSRESAVGNLVADAVRERTGGDVAVFNGGGIRANVRYPAGHTLTRRDVLSELPFANTTVLVELTGEDLKAVLENGVSRLDTPAGRFLQVSGLRLVVDGKAAPGSRVVSVEIGGEPLDPARRYKVAANNYMYAGGDGYGSLAAGRTLIGLTDGKLVANEVMAYIREIGTVRTGVEGRIVIR